MSQLLVQNYLNEIDRLRKYSRSSTEGVISGAFGDLLKAWSRQLNWQFVAQYEFQSVQKTRIRPDGTIFHSIGVPFGYWEAKDTADDLDAEIASKLRKGYPQDNIIFENSETAVLIQNRNPVFRASMTDTDALLKLLSLFFGYEPEAIGEFRRAVAQFTADLPRVLDTLRDMIDAAYRDDERFRFKSEAFLRHAQETINPSVGEADVREMLIQHILTEEIFAQVFNDDKYHRENNIAQKLYELEATFFTRAVKQATMRGLEPYYATIRSTAAQITSHSEKQTFLKVIYENFYKVYNPKAAERLGVVYTPNEIVKFMIEGADWLTLKHFGKALIEPGVEILDPATGTGTFITELLQHFAFDRRKMAQKYKNELHANEVAILPYYVANLNIEATHFGITGQFAEFENLCFVDTLDNVEGLGVRTGQHVGDLFGALSDENVERVKRQNKRKISVIIGNPPYFANQANENDNNKSREYPHIDKAIKDSYIKLSTAQKIKVYDMYARFFRWASDRLHDDGVLAFITNRSFIDSRTFDGFRRAVASEFNEIYMMDLGGDVRANPKLSGTKHNVFGIQTGVAISFFVKRHKQKGCKIFYARRPEFDTADDKLSWLGSNRATDIAWQRVEPDKNANWVNLTDNEWDDLVPIADKKTKVAKGKGQEKAIFRLLSFGIATNRDEWLYDHARDALSHKVSFFVDAYEAARNDWARLGDARAPVDQFGPQIKWTTELQQHARRGTSLRLDEKAIREIQYRPFVRIYGYYAPAAVHRTYQQPTVFPFHADVRANEYLAITDPTAQKPWMVTASNFLPDLHLVGAAAGAVALPRYRYTSSGERIDNITDWALKEFQKAYGKDGLGKPAKTGAEDDDNLISPRVGEIGRPRKSRVLTKNDIFHYVYAVLHDPAYREKYAINLKREFPRIPFYPDFWKWAAWGETLMTLHIGFEEVEPWPLARTDLPDEKARAAGVSPKALLKSDRDNGIIRLDTETTLSDIPKQAWDYRLGNRSGVDWILDQYKEKTPKDPTIREKFNTYRFADYKEKVVDLLMRVTRVSVETVAVTEAMKDAKR